jgi:hypothetical protein
MILRHEWSPRYRIAHGWKIWVWIWHQGTDNLWSKKNRGECLLIFLILFYFLLIFSLFLSFFFSFFSHFFLLFFSSHHIFFSFFIFFFCSLELLQHNTYKEVITKRCFWFRVEAQWSLWNFRCENPQCMDKKASMKKLHKGMTSLLVSNHRNES